MEAKSIKSIYFNSALLQEAFNNQIDVGVICNEALKLAVHRDANSGSVEGAFGNFLNNQDEKAKEAKLIRKLSATKDGRLNTALRAFCEKYDIPLHVAIKEAGI
jgi:hypothetical protein